MSTSIILLLIGLVLLLVVLFFYNTLVRKRNFVKNCFADIDAMLKKRYDMIPNLIGTVKKYMEHEKEVMRQITELRTRAQDAGQSPDERVKTDNQLSGVVRNLFMTLENYPDLKANTVFLNLEQSWNETEDEISASRRSFNMAVYDYNNSVQMFPSMIVARAFAFRQMESFSIPEEARLNVDFNKTWNR